ncbi:UbiA family prenyltransferase [Leptotrichia sp. oral taxon 223]|uniref:UbiA family prenyltransferase n=1 Tax=Leptotrichia sp. oral taxon 223 TaxID=712363 RepID=UPI0015BF784B|nr:UbiA family prenyltransferase [Leptotrichia sp. oral taxon 223]NWO18111.1 UbiA family prenyltransferase [Leptotrichia sp. oral taxon 223]
MNESNINSKKSIIQYIKNFKIYLNERFPLGKNSFFVLIFTLSGYIYTSLLYNSKIMYLFTNGVKIGIFQYKIIALFIIIFMFFFQLRITDEFKDYEEDLKYRAYRPVQRGIISLKTLGKIGIATVIIQIMLAHVIDPEIIYFMIFVWIYMFLMAKEFFIKKWLTKRILIYALSHVVIMVFITLVIVEATQYIVPKNIFDVFILQWYKHNIDFALIPLFALNYLNGIVLEIGRKTRKNDEEEHGVQTYSKLWGRKKAVVILSLLFVIEYFLVILGLAHTYEKYFLFSGLTLLVILIVSIYFMVKFLKQDLSGKIVEAVSGLWIIFSSMSMGLLPYLFFSLTK